MSLPARRLVSVGGALLFAFLLVRTAWLDDDAYITFRTVDNLLNGYGARWNVANRVQSYTHPLWMLAMTGVTAVVGNVYYGSLLLSAAVSLCALLLASSRLACSAAAAILMWSVLGLSKAFVDYSTSGLENPLTHLLLAVFFTIQFSRRPDRRRLLLLSGTTALLMLNRFDTGLLVLPSLGAGIWRAGVRRVWPWVALGMLPLAAWELFSIVYYGFPFPNTAYSKIGTGVPRAELMVQGLLYLLDSLNNDPLTLLIIAMALVSPLFGVRTGPLPAGIALYLAYIVWVGGDFMSGRFLTAPLFGAVIHLTRTAFPLFSPQWAVAMAVVWLVGVTTPRPTILSNAGYGSDVDPMRLMSPTGIMDERRYYYPQSGLLTAHRGVPMPNHKWLHMGYEDRARGRKVAYTDAAGFIGYAAGPTVHYVDRYGLGDPLLARLPADTPWRIGHFVRRLPEGYLETLEHGRNVIRDPGVGAYYERLRLITEGPIWSRERLRAILNINLGRYERFVAGYGLVRLDPLQLPTEMPATAAWNAPGAVPLTHRGAEITFDGEQTGGALEISVSGDDVYDVEWRRGDRVQRSERIAPRMTPAGALTAHTLAAPGDVRFDTLAVRPSRGDGRYSIGHLRLRPAAP
jgi:arabinofuranosyltransferase